MPFLVPSRLARIEVVGIPALECQVCHEQLYDLALLAHKESEHALNAQNYQSFPCGSTRQGSAEVTKTTYFV